MTKDDVKTIMLIDDNSTDRFIHRKLLNIYKIGEEVLEQASGRTALDYLRKNKDEESQLPDLILLDVLMPEMNGFDFLIHLESFVGDLSKKPIIFMLSSTDDERDLRRARNSHLVKKMLRKPFSPEALIKALQKDQT